MPYYVRLDNRAVLEMAGEDARALLQGLVTNGPDGVTPARAVHSMLLTPQGRYLFDFVLAEGDGGALWLASDATRLADLQRRMTMYRLRAKAEIRPRPDLAVHAAWDGAAEVLGLPGEAGAAKLMEGGGLLLVDPRSADLGALAIGDGASIEAMFEAAGFERAGIDAYRAHRLDLGVPDAVEDLVPERSLPLENLLEETHGVDFNKGCYVGQELTARTKYKALLKKRLTPVALDGEAPVGAAIVQAGKEVGELRSNAGGIGLAVLRLDALGKEEAMEAEGVTLRVR